MKLNYLYMTALFAALSIVSAEETVVDKVEDKVEEAAAEVKKEVAEIAADIKDETTDAAPAKKADKKSMHHHAQHHAHKAGRVNRANADKATDELNMSLPVADSSACGCSAKE